MKLVGFRIYPCEKYTYIPYIFSDRDPGIEILGILKSSNVEK